SQLELVLRPHLEARRFGGEPILSRQKERQQESAGLVRGGGDSHPGLKIGGLHPRTDHGGGGRIGDAPREGGAGFLCDQRKYVRKAKQRGNYAIHGGLPVPARPRRGFCKRFRDYSDCRRAPLRESSGVASK